MILGITVTIIN